MLPSSGNRLRIVTAAVLLLSLVACSGSLDPDDYEQITPGMSSAGVRSLLGKPTSGGGFDLGDTVHLSTGTWIWEKDHRKVIVVFRDDQVLSKRKLGF